MPTVAFIGDVMLGRGVAEELPRRAPESFWGTVHPLLTSVDAVVANLECAVTDHPRRWDRTSKVFHFRAPPAAMAVLQAGNVRCVSLANNHVLDFETEGLLDTLRHLDAAGIAHAGAGPNLAAARTPAVIDAGGLKVGIIAATDNEPAFAATATEPGTNYCDFSQDPGAAADLAAAAKAARTMGAATLVASLHWGPNMVVEPPPAFRRFARATLGWATVLHGHSAHVFQGVEALNGRTILYDTGDILDDYAVDPGVRNDWSFVFVAELTTAGRLRRVRMIPVRLGYARVDLATGSERDEILARMVARARAVGTELVTTDEGLALGTRW